MLDNYNHLVSERKTGEAERALPADPRPLPHSSQCQRKTRGGVRPTGYARFKVSSTVATSPFERYIHNSSYHEKR
jgi:hypothetical protein